MRPFGDYVRFEVVSADAVGRRALSTLARRALQLALAGRDLEFRSL